MTVKRGKRCRLLARVADAKSAEVTLGLTIMNRAGAVKKSWSWGYGTTPPAGGTFGYTCTVAEGA